MLIGAGGSPESWGRRVSALVRPAETRWSAGAIATAKGVLTALLNPVAVAVSCLFVL